MTTMTTGKWRNEEGPDDRFFGLNPDDLGQFVSSTGVLYLPGASGGAQKNVMNDDAAKLAVFLDCTPVGKTVKVLILSGNMIRHRGFIRLAQAIAVHENLERVYLNNNRIGGGETGRWLMNLLKQNKTLEVLDLSGNPLDDNDTEFLPYGLAENTTMTHLNLENSQFVTSDGIGLLAESLSKNTTLVSLRVTLDDELKDLRNIGDLVNGDGQLDLSGKNLDPWDALRIAWLLLSEAGKAIKVLKMSNCPSLGWRYRPDTPPLLHGQKPVPGSLNNVLAALKGNTTLEELHLDGCEIGGGNADQIGLMLQYGYHGLKKLVLKNNQLNSGMTASYIAQGIRNGCGPETLDLQKNRFGDTEAEWLASALNEAKKPRVARLDLRGNNISAKVKEACVAEIRVVM